jgi:hypothetical protein
MENTNLTKLEDALYFLDSIRKVAKSREKEYGNKLGWENHANEMRIGFLKKGIDGHCKGTPVVYHPNRSLNRPCLRHTCTAYIPNGERKALKSIMDFIEAMFPSIPTSYIVELKDY